MTDRQTISYIKDLVAQIQGELVGLDQFEQVSSGSWHNIQQKLGIAHRAAQARSEAASVREATNSSASGICTLCGAPPAVQGPSHASLPTEHGRRCSACLAPLIKA